MAAKPVMIQGTASSVGKSIIAAGLCRLFKQDGYKVAPFKSQNMALNSFITHDGKEMGRAQVVQAEAAGIEPSVEMNPILLKPTGDKKAQVIINGEVYANMSATEYHDFKPSLAEMIRNIYNELAAKNDIIVIEGAGSPAEINLRDKDIVNMGMAQIADSPVILVGDIDKGGVFASLAGTMQLLTEDERTRVKGVIINKFRGDIEILKPGIRMLEDIIKVPVLGVVPYFRLNIDDEDSLSERLVQNKKCSDYDIDIVVIRLPHISNFTDFNVFEGIQGVRIRYVEEASQIGEPDLVILPGTKNTIEDLIFLKETGMEKIILTLAKEGTFVFGICGGYQMLGLEVLDPHNVESDISLVNGLGLLNFKTVFEQKKVTTRTKAVVTDSYSLVEGLHGIDIEGYEIHMGITEYFKGCIPFLTMDSGLSEGNTPGGVRNTAGNVLGTYIHGIFDNIDFTIGIINNIRKMKGLNRIDSSGLEYRKVKENQYDELADILRGNLDIACIYRILSLK
ncbi:MAG: cobyric acid synthase [Bacillota bacterium]